MALLAMLGLLLLIFTTTVIGGVSRNSQIHQRGQHSAASLAAVRDALMGYSLTANTTLQPPGSLPCPAQNRQGLPVGINPATGLCSILRGLVPYRALNISEPLDGSGAPIWYAPSASLAGNTNNLRNSSSSANLRLKINARNRTEEVAFVLLAPNQPIDGQQPNTGVTLAPAEFLEGVNGAVNTTQYDDLNDAQHNDQLLAVPSAQFWAQIEQRVFREVRQILQNYITQCNGLYPWAADWTGRGHTSQANLYAGSVPLNWGTNCGAGLLAPVPPPAPPASAAWLRTHWSGLFYYAICNQPVAVNPPAASCLQVTTPTGATAAKALIILPGPALGAVVPAQNRSLPGRNHYFEALNADANDNTFTQLPFNQHTQVFNDVLFIIE